MIVVQKARNFLKRISSLILYNTTVVNAQVIRILKNTRIDSSHFVFTGKEWIQVKPLLSVHPFPGESLTSKSLGTGANMAAIKGSPMSCIDYLCLLVYLAFVSPGFKRSGISKSACPISRPCGVII